MPGRDEAFIVGGIYHIFNKTIDSRALFVNSENASKFLQTLQYYRSVKATKSLSDVKKLQPELRKSIFKEVSFKKYFQVDILGYCLMPTHFHLLLKQIKEDGVVRFMAKGLNSFTRWFNLKHQRVGPLFLPRFRSRRVKADNQLLHVSRYIHLNPFSSGLVKQIVNLKRYPWSSYPEYVMERKNKLSNPKEILAFFDGDSKEYEDFVTQQADYQRTLEEVKYAEKW